MNVAAKLACAAAVCAALIAAERGCAQREVASAAVERLVPPERIAGRTTAAFTLETHGASRLYVRAKGLWRCRAAYGAVCDGAAVEAFLSGVLDARGALASTGREAVERAGLRAADGLRVALHGTKVLSDPQRDVLVELAFGPSREGATFAGVAGVERVLAVDRDPRALLDVAAGAPAPLVDTRVLAGSLAADFAGFERMFVDRGADAAEPELELASTPAAAPGGERRWRVTAGGTASDAILWRVGGYASLWIRVRFERLADPRTVTELGLDPPLATITLAPDTGEPVELRVSAADATGRVYVWNRRTNVVGAVRADLLPLMAPSAADFTRAEGGNPWEAWLTPR